MNIDLTKLTNNDLKQLKQQTAFEISKYKNLQLAKKVCLNSVYGAFGSPTFRYYSIENASAVTLSGQLSIRWIEKKLNQVLNTLLGTTDTDYVLAIDTDSIYLHLGSLVDKVLPNETNKTKIVNFLDKFCSTKLQPIIDKSFQELATYLNCFDQKMQMKRESIADSGFWVAKKRYALSVWDAEGVRYGKPEIKVSGMEIIKSSTPEKCRKKLKETLKIILTSNLAELKKYIFDFEQEFKAWKIEDISFPRSVQGFEKYTCTNLNNITKGAPIHVRGALVFNTLLKDKGLTKKYKPIVNKSKIRFCYLKLPNPAQSHVIAFVDKLPKELGLDSYIDYDVQFDKVFLEPVKQMINSIGWSISTSQSLEDLFV